MDIGMLWLIDEHGKAWPPSTHPISRWSGAADPLEYAVQDLGFIQLRPLTSGLTVRFNPRRLGWRTMISGFYLIAEMRPRRIALSYEDDNSAPEIFGRVVDGLRRIEELIDKRPRDTAALSQTGLLLDGLPDNIARGIEIQLLRWRDRSGLWTTEERDNLLGAFSPANLSIIWNPGGTDRLIYDHFGANFSFLLGPRWLAFADGKRVEQQPFPGLTVQAARDFRHAARSREPMVTAIDATLSSAGVIVARNAYTRLLLPWMNANGEAYLTVFRYGSPTSYRAEWTDASVRSAAC